ncbi:MAG TPA: hypothetical protein PLO50_01670 [Nitrospira sp.]|nr:hypothetical protein [Nitrospira sp.]
MTMITANEQVFTTLKQLGTECPLEEIMDLCPGITWNQAFLAIDHLSRTGQVRVRVDAGRTYWVQTHHCDVENSPSSSSVGSQAFA